jgi:hypothetical protein
MLHNRYGLLWLVLNGDFSYLSHLETDSSIMKNRPRKKGDFWISAGPEHPEHKEGKCETA